MAVHDRLRWEVRAQLRESIPEALLQNNLAPVVRAFGDELTEGNLGAVFDRPAEAFKPGEGGGFDGGFSESPSAHVAAASWISFSVRPIASFHSSRPLADLPDSTPAAVEGELKV